MTQHSTYIGSESGRAVGGGIGVETASMADQSPNQIRQRQAAALAFDWDHGDLKVLGAILSKLGLDLATAVQVFLNGDPERFNYLERDEVPLNMTARVAMLDCLYMKISYGFYLPDPALGLASVRRETEAWMAQQRRDQSQGITRRWVFNESHFSAISDQGPRKLMRAPRNVPKSALWRTLFVPMWVRA